MANSRRVEYLPLADLVEDPRNPKNHDEVLISESIERFGMMEPIVRDERTGYIVSGHGRRMVLAQLEDDGGAVPDGVRVDKDGTWLVPVVVGWASASDVEAGAALIALNRTGEISGWVDDSLLELLDELAREGGAEALDGVGFYADDIDELRKKLNGDLDVDFSDLDDESEGTGKRATQVECPNCQHTFEV